MPRLRQVQDYRELQVRRQLGLNVRLGRQRVSERGYWTGGNPPYGMRRLLVDAKGNPLHLLEPGQRKDVHSHRVALVVGESSEVAAIRGVFREFADLGYSTARIAQALNAKQSPAPGGGPWTTRHVLASLRNKAYAAPIAYCQKKVRGVLQWVRRPEAGEGIVSAEQFERAQEILGGDQNRSATSGGAGG